MDAKGRDGRAKMGGEARMAAAANAYAQVPEERPRIDIEASAFGPDQGAPLAMLAIDAGDAGDAGGASAAAALDPEKHAMVLECLPLVKYIARRIADRTPKSVEVDDLIGDGIMGLLDAAGHFDPARGVKFRTYAEQRIRGAILDSLRSLDWVPRSLRQKQKDIEDAYHVLSMRHGRAAEDEEVALHLGVPLADLHRSLDDLKGVTLGSFEDASGEGEGLLALIADPDAEDPHATLTEKEIKGLLARTVEELPHKEKLVVQMYYYSERNMKEIGAVMGITESRVSQLHTKAMLRLRGRLRHGFAA
jgi:RNA polymerase sigma factor for flagellar operon FliA